MQMNHIVLQSQNFAGDPILLLEGVGTFLENVKKNHVNKKDFHLVHALVFSKNMAETEVKEINQKLGDLYRKWGFDVLGGDTSGGIELNIFISTIVF